MIIFFPSLLYTEPMVAAGNIANRDQVIGLKKNISYDLLVSFLDFVRVRNRSLGTEKLKSIVSTSKAA